MACAEALPCASETDPKQAANCGLFSFALRLYHIGTPHRGHTQPHRWHVLRLYAMRAATDGMCCGSMLCERLPSAQAAALPCRNTPQRAHRQPQRWLPAQYTIGRETARLSDYRGHRLRLYHVGTPHSGRTDSLSDGYRHNIPSGERQRASATTEGTGCGSTM